MAMLDETALDALLEVAGAAADAARGPCLAHFRGVGLVAENKAAAGARYDPVTAADKAAERAMRATLAALRPDDAVLGEEEADSAGTSGVSWIIDPIDGTRGYMSGTPTWGVLVAANDGERPVVGVIDQPFTGERFEGISAGARRVARWRRGAETRALRTRACAALGEAVLYTTFPEIGTPAERDAFERVKAEVRLTRYGLDCYAYALLAAGCLDLVIEAGLQTYDVQALIPVIEGAGGVVTAWDGGDCQHGGRVLAAGDPRLHAAAMALLAGS